MATLPILEAKPDLEEMVFHLKGMIEAFEVISSQAHQLDAAIDSDLDRATDVMGRLEAEIYTHLVYHMKEMRKPFRRFFRTACRKLDELERIASKKKSRP